MGNRWVEPALDKLVKKGLGGDDRKAIEKGESITLINE